MPKPPSKPASAEPDHAKPYHHGDLKTALLEAAEALLRETGVDGLTLRAVARRAGVSHAAPTHHFGDLTGLLSDLAAIGYTRFEARMRAAAEAAMASGAAPGPALGRAYISFARDEPALFLLMFRSQRLDMSRSPLREAADAAFRLTSGTMADGTTTPGPALAPALAAWSLVHGVAMLMLDHRLDDCVPPGGTLEQVIEATLASVRIER